MRYKKLVGMSCVVALCAVMAVTLPACSSQSPTQSSSAPSSASSTEQTAPSTSETPSTPQSASASTEVAVEGENAMEAFQSAFSEFMECDESSVSNLIDAHTLQVAKKYGASKEDVAAAISMTFEGDVPTANDDTGEYAVKVTCVPVNEVISHYVDSVYNGTEEYEDLAEALVDAEPVEQETTFTLVQRDDGMWTLKDGSSVTAAIAGLCLGSLPSDWDAY